MVWGVNVTKTQGKSMFFASGNLGGTKAIWAAPRGIQQEFDACFCYKTIGNLTFDPP